jgi:hypothetical protein
MFDKWTETDWYTWIFKAYALTFTNTLFCLQCIYVFCVDLRKNQRLLISTANNVLFFITEAESVYCSVQTGPSSQIDKVSSFKVNCEVSAMWETKPRTTPQKTSGQLMGPDQVTRPKILQAIWWWWWWWLWCFLYSFATLEQFPSLHVKSYRKSM